MRPFSTSPVSFFHFMATTTGNEDFTAGYQPLAQMKKTMVSTHPVRVLILCTDRSTSAHSQNDQRVQIEDKRNELFDDTPAGNAVADHAVADLARRAPGLCVGINAADIDVADSGSDSDDDADGHFHKRSNTCGGGGGGCGDSNSSDID